MSGGKLSDEDEQNRGLELPCAQSNKQQRENNESVWYLIFAGSEHRQQGIMVAHDELLGQGHRQSGGTVNMRLSSMKSGRKRWWNGKWD
jgi:hypothetical protein